MTQKCWAVGAAVVLFLGILTAGIEIPGASELQRQGQTREQGQNPP